MGKEKLFTMEEAISRFIDDGSELALGTCLESLIPFGAGHEIIRRGKKNLTLIGPISDILFDQLIGAGCVKKIRAAWVGNVITGSGYNFRRAVEKSRIEMEDHSNLTISAALYAGANGLPFMPVRTALGSDLFKTNKSLKKIKSPFTGETVAGVKAITPDIAIIHAQRSDKYGNAHIWGNLGILKEACLAAKSVIITCEEIVSKETITTDPARVIIPGFLVKAVVHCPWGAHPSPVPGYYNRDHEAFIEYRNSTKSSEDYENWKNIWIDKIKGRDEYILLMGKKRLKKLSIQKNLKSEPVDYGY